MLLLALTEGSVSVPLGDLVVDRLLPFWLCVVSLEPCEPEGVPVPEAATPLGLDVFWWLPDGLCVLSLVPWPCCPCPRCREEALFGSCKGGFPPPVDIVMMMLMMMKTANISRFCY